MNGTTLLNGGRENHTQDKITLLHAGVVHIEVPVKVVCEENTANKYNRAACKIAVSNFIANFIAVTQQVKQLSKS